MSKVTFGLLALLALVLAPSLPAAICSDPTGCSFQFTVHNVGPGFPPLTSYGDLTLTRVIDPLNAAHFAVQFDIALASGYRLIGTGAGGGFGFAFNDNLAAGTALSYTYPSIPYPYSGGSATSGGSNHWDGFGDFEDVAANAGGMGASCVGCLQNVSFTVSTPNGFSSVLQLVAANAIGNYFAADVYDSNGDCGGACTGLIAVVPEPGFYGMLAIGLGGLFVAIDKRRKAAKS